MFSFIILHSLPLALDFDPLEYCPFGICPLLKSLLFTYQPLWVLVLGRVCWRLALKAISCILLRTGSLIILVVIPARVFGLTMNVGVGIWVWKAAWLGQGMVVCVCFLSLELDLHVPFPVWVSSSTKLIFLLSHLEMFPKYILHPLLQTRPPLHSPVWVDV